MSISMMIDKREVEGSCGFMDDERYFGGNKQVLVNDEKAWSSSCSSSIGENSDSILSHDESMDEVESPFTSMQPLHQFLPIREGMSRFYNGKSKSFTSLREASTLCSIKELAKPENGSYIKEKRRNILACHLPNKKMKMKKKKKKKKSISKKKHIDILAMRSFSLADLQFVSLTTTPPGLKQEAQKKPTH